MIRSKGWAILSVGERRRNASQAAGLETGATQSGSAGTPRPTHGTHFSGTLGANAALYGCS